MFIEYIKVNVLMGQTLEEFLREASVLALENNTIVKAGYNDSIYIINPITLLGVIRDETPTP